MERFFKHIELTAKYPIRSPNENVLRVNSSAHYTINRLNEGVYQSIEKFKVSEPERIIKKILPGLPHTMIEAIDILHGRGDPIEEVAQRVAELLAVFDKIPESDNRKLMDDYTAFRDLRFIAICLLIISDHTSLNEFIARVRFENSNRFYLFELFFKAFIPDWKLPKKYSRKGLIKHSLSWSDPLQKILATDDKSVGLVDYLRHYEKFTQKFVPYGWVPWGKLPPEKQSAGRPGYGNANHDFAFGVALAVCAWDIDDAEFRSHPYYPRDLVDYYRNNIRHTRDQWRAEGVGPGVAVELPPRPPKMDLSKSKSKNVKRFVELVADGDTDVVGEVMLELGRVKKIKEPDEFFLLLSEAGVAARADVKDSDKLQDDLTEIFAVREIGEAVSSDATNAGVERSEIVLSEAHAAAIKRGYNLLQMDTEEDAFASVLIDIRYLEELTNLASQIGLKIIN